jgi:UDPglucose 6-dehydrogenase
MKLGVIGLGTVGSAVYESFITIGHDVKYFDTKYDDSSLNNVLDTEAVFVCVPTGMNSVDGSCDTSIVEYVISELDQNHYTGVIVIKSTVIPGTTKRLIKEYPDLNIVCSPEFLRAKTALSDFLYNQDVLVIGTNDKNVYDFVKSLHNRICTNVKMVSPTEAEIIKYFNNVHHAVHVVFANMMYDTCKSLGCDYENVYDAIGERNCINTSYLNCNENLREFGGECLPKDISAWDKLIKDLDVNYSFIQSVINDNDAITK